jgi:ketosteroid isomerase-like protein
LSAWWRQKGDPRAAATCPQMPRRRSGSFVRSLTFQAVRTKGRECLRGRREILPGAMAEGRIEHVRRLYAALARGDTQRMLELLHPIAELHQPREAPDAASYYGREELVRGTTDFLSAWDNFTFEPLEVTAVGDGVLAHMRLTGKREGQWRRSNEVPVSRMDLPQRTTAPPVRLHDSRGGSRSRRVARVGRDLEPVDPAEEAIERDDGDGHHP